MKAYAYSDEISLKTLRVIEHAEPEPGPNDVVLRMRAAALNFRDLAIAKHQYHLAVNPPLIPLSDGAGEVIHTGSAVTRVRRGDIACPTYLPDWLDGAADPDCIRRRLGGPDNGVLREFICLNEQAVVRAPQHLDALEAATLPVTAVTAWHSLYCLGDLRPGDSILVQGTGGVSTIAIQIARAGGAHVIVVTRDDQRLQRLKQLGADNVIVGRGKWPRRVYDLTGDRGADVALNVAGGDTLADFIATCRIGATVHMVGYASNRYTTFDIFEAIRHAVVIRVATAGPRRSFESLIRAMEVHHIRPAIDREFDVSDIQTAFEYLASGRHFGKIVLRWPT